LYRQGEAVWHFAHERVHEGSLWGGASSYRRSIAPPKDLFLAAKRLLDELKWHGVGMVEFRVDQNGEFFLMEINPRLWGSLALAIDAGVDFPMGLLGIAEGQTLPSQPGYRKHYYARNIVDDIPWQLANLRADRMDPTLRTRNPFAALAEFSRPLIGRESWDFFDWRDLAVTASQLRQVATHILRTATYRWRRRRLARYLIRHHARQFRRRSHRKEIQNVLFLCYGNICRSPFAAELARVKLAQYRVQSAGLDAGNQERRTPEEIVEVARTKGIDLSNHHSIRVTDEHVRWADLILVMDLDNYTSLVRQWPEAALRTDMLGLFAAPPCLSISDPYGAPAAEASQIFDTILTSLSGLESWLQ